MTTLSEDIDNEITRVFVERLAELNLPGSRARIFARAARAALLREIERAGLALLPCDPSVKMVHAGKEASGFAVDARIIAALWRAMAAAGPKFDED